MRVSYLWSAIIPWYLILLSVSYLAYRWSASIPLICEYHTAQQAPLLLLYSYFTRTLLYSSIPLICEYHNAIVGFERITRPMHCFTRTLLILYPTKCIPLICEYHNAIIGFRTNNAPHALTCLPHRIQHQQVSLKSPTDAYKETSECIQRDIRMHGKRPTDAYKETYECI